MSLLRNLASGLLTFLIVPLLVIFLFANNFTNTLLNQNNFLGTLSANKTYTTITKDILPSLIIDTVAGGEDKQGIPKEVITKVVNNVDKDLLAKDLERTVGDVYRYATGVSQTLETKIDLQPYVNSLRDQIKPGFLDYYANLPACTPEQEKAFNSSTDSSITCQLKGVSGAQAADKEGIDQTVADLIISAPKTITITKNQIIFDPPLNKNQPESNNFSLENVKNTSVAVRPATTYLLLAVAGMLLLLFLIHLPNFRAGLRSVAWVLVSASIVPLVISTAFLFFVSPNTLINFFATTLNVKNGSSYQETILGLINSNIYDLAHKIFQGVQIQGIILLALGIVLFATAFVLDKRHKEAHREHHEETSATVAIQN